MATPRRDRPKREYSREFRPRGNAKRRQFNIDAVPPALHDAVLAKAKREGVSLRALVLSFLQDWSK